MPKANAPLDLNYDHYIPNSKLPPHKIENVGNKVSWYRFANKEDAEAASKIAIHNGEIQLSAGYDFGYMCVGSITENQDGSYTVVFP